MQTIATVEHDLDFSPIHRAMQRYIDDGILACCSTLVMRGTEVLDYATFGFMDLETRAPLHPRAIYRMYSNTKIVTSVALMMLYEQGRFALDDPLETFMPSFGNVRVLKAGAGSADDLEDLAEPIRIRHLLSHSAGLSYGFIEPDSVIDRAYMAGGINVLANASASLEEFCDRVAGLPLAYQPGTSWRYSVATDVCARLVEVLSGESFEDYLETRIFAPLGMDDTAFHVPPDKTGRFITQYAPEDLLDPMKPGLKLADDPVEGVYARERRFKSGGGGLVSTIGDYLTFLRMIVAGGEWQGVRILQPGTLALMRTNQLPPGVGVSFPMWDMPGTVFGLGFALKETLSQGEPPAMRDEYHWGGMAGTHTWMAPRASLTGMCATQRMPGFWHPFSHEFKALAYQIAS